MEAPYDAKKTERQINASLADFLHHGEWRKLEGVDQDSAVSLLKVFLDAAHKDLGLAPERLDAPQLREILLRRMPRRISAARTSSSSRSMRSGPITPGSRDTIARPPPRWTGSPAGP